MVYTLSTKEEEKLPVFIEITQNCESGDLD